MYTSDALLDTYRYTYYFEITTTEYSPNAIRPVSRCNLRSYLVKQILQELTKIPARNTRTIFEH